MVHRPRAGANWTINDEPLKDQRLKHGDRIEAREHGDLELSCRRPNVKDEEVFMYSCRSQTCRARVCEPTGEGMDVRRAGVIRGLMDWWSARVTRQPVLPVIAAVRAGGNAADAVLLQDARGVHWGPALSRVLEGRSCFRLASLPEGPSSRVATFTLDWDRSVDPEGILRVPNVFPGLFALEKGTAGANGSCNRDPDAFAAWVLIVPSADFARVGAEFSEQRKSIAALEQSGLSLGAAANIRHAGLAYLAQSFPPK